MIGRSVVALLALCGALSPLAAATAAEIARGSYAAVIGLVQKNGKAEPATVASGFFISDRHVVTQLARCCTPPEGLQIKSYVVAARGQGSPARMIWSAKDKYAAIFELEKPLEGAAAKLVPWKATEPNQTVFGFALKDGTPSVLEGKLIGAVTLKNSTTKLLQVKFTGDPHQGSAMFDACGNVAGLIIGASQSGEILVLAIDELADAIGAAKANPQMVEGVCGSAGAKTGTKEKDEKAGKTQSGPPKNALLYTLIVVAVLLVLAFASRRGRDEVAKVMTSRRADRPGQAVAQPFVQPPGPAPGQFQPQRTPLEMQQAAALVYHQPGTRARLRGLNGFYAGNAIDLENGAWVLGRDQRVANIVFPATTETVSKKHCTIWYDVARRVFVLEDNGSTNGTWLTSGECLAAGRPRDLRPGERFCVGDQTNLFEVAVE